MQKEIRTTDQFSIVYHDQKDESSRKELHENLKLFNNTVSPYHKLGRTTGSQSLDVFIRDTKGQLVGGLTAATYWECLSIDDLWVDESFRGQGLGRELMQIAEEEALRRGIVFAFLTTFSFQARGFYEKLGFQVVGELTDYPPGESYFTLRKDY